MTHRRLVLFVEGSDDGRFFDKIIKPMFDGKYTSVIIWPYAQKGNTKVSNFLKSIKSMGDDYIYFRDINDAPCVTMRKQEIQNEFSKFNIGIDIDRQIVVIQEIESWYLAGLDAANSRNLRVSSSGATDNLDKEQFNGLLPKRFGSRIDFMVEILKCFSVEIAKQRNKSFRYFLEKHNCRV